MGVSGAAPDWTAALPGVRVVDQPGRPGASRHDGDGRVLLELDDGADEQAILDAARAAGRVTHFSAAEPTLADLFREAVRP